MQFTGHSLPVHQSMSVPWEFFTPSHFISQFSPTRFPLITAIRMCYLLPVHHLGMAFLPIEGQNTTHVIMVKAMVCEIVAREFELQSRYYVHCRTNTLGKAWNSLSSQIWVK